MADYDGIEGFCRYIDDQVCHYGLCGEWAEEGCLFCYTHLEEGEKD